MRIRPDPKDIAEIYIDESSQNNHRFLVIGAILVMQQDSSSLCDLIMKARLPDLPEKEAKWGKVSNFKLKAYRRLVDIVFDKPDLVHFHSLFVDTTRIDHGKY